MRAATISATFIRIRDEECGSVSLGTSIHSFLLKLAGRQTWCDGFEHNNHVYSYQIGFRVVATAKPNTAPTHQRGSSRIILPTSAVPLC